MKCLWRSRIPLHFSGGEGGERFGDVVQDAWRQKETADPLCLCRGQTEKASSLMDLGPTGGRPFSLLRVYCRDTTSTTSPL